MLSIKETPFEPYNSENVFIISRCPEFAESGLIQWFDAHNFFDDTNFSRSNIYFCREQAEKAPIAKQLKLSYFIDDKISVLDFMNDIVLHKIQLTVDPALEIGDDKDGIMHLENWPSVLEYIAGF